MRLLRSSSLCIAPWFPASIIPEPCTIKTLRSWYVIAAKQIFVKKYRTIHINVVNRTFSIIRSAEQALFFLIVYSDLSNQQISNVWSFFALPGVQSFIYLPPSPSFMTSLRIYICMLGRSDWRSVLTGRSKRPMQMRSWHHWLKWIINDLIPSGYLHKKDVHSNSTLVVTPEGLKTANAELAFFNSRVFVNYSSSVEAQLVSRRRYASVVFLLLTCLINLCCLTLIGRRKVKSQLLFFS